ncbi:hypothetical protein SAMN05421757_1201, partial [Tropicimonas sediminicola]
YTRSTFAKATVMPRLADFCSAQWSVFAPPLTPDYPEATQHPVGKTADSP